MILKKLFEVNLIAQKYFKTYISAMSPWFYTRWKYG
jgi:hypothetical protein